MRGNLVIYKKLVIQSLLIALFFSPSLFAIELNYQLTNELDNAITEAVFKTQQGAPDIYFTKKNKRCVEHCQKALSFGGKRTLTFAENASLITGARYANQSFAIIKEPVKETSDSRFYFVSSVSLNKYSSYLLPFNICNELSMGMTPTGDLLCLTEDQLQIYRNPKGTTIREDIKQTIKLPETANIGVINNNLAGHIAIAMVNINTQTLYYTTLNNLLMDKPNDLKWSSHYTLIHNRSDSRNVLAVYPKDAHRGVVAAYEYVNVLNKNTTVYDIKDESVNRRIVTNNINSNFGFHPEVFFNQKAQVVLTAMSSEDNKAHSFELTNELLTQPETFYSDHPEQSSLDFLAGYSAAYQYWSMSQDAGEHISTDYDIDASLLQSVYIQARYSDTQLTVKYLTGQAQKNTTNTASYLTGLIDFSGFFEGADTLRLKVDWSQISGTATYHSTNYAIDGKNHVSADFDTEYKNFEVLIFSELGQYIGLSYSTQSLPSAIALSESEKSENIIGWAFDKNYKQTAYMLKVGSDEAAYGARYEVNYNRYYFRPSLALGIINRQLSRAAIAEATADLENKSVAGKLTWAASFGVDLGYTHQRRWEQYKGLGYSIQVGLHAQLYFQAESFETADDDEVYAKMDRLDANYGPFIQFNAIF